VNQVLETDSKYRYEGVMDDLYRFEDLRPVQWDFSLPTLTQSKILTNLSTKSTADFVGNFYEEFPFLHGMCMNNVLVAGGCVSSILMKDTSYKDVDIFIYGLDTKQADEKVKYLIDFLSKHGNEDISVQERTNDVVKTKNVINIYHASHCNDIQIILRLYKTKSEVLHGFDIGSCAVGFDGKDVLFTSLSKFTYETMCNIVDVTRRSLTYEHRLVKYFQRRFNIILPDLDISKMTLKTNTLPYCSIHVRYMKGNLLCGKINTQNEDSDYWSPLPTYPFFLYENTKFRYNIEMLLQDKPESMIGTLIKEGTYYYLSEDRISSFYKELPGMILDQGKFRYEFVQKYLSIPVSEVSTRLFDEGRTKKEMRSYIESACNLECKAQLNRWKTIMESEVNLNSLNWMIENPGKQFTSSFNPVFSNPQEWYGNYIK